MWELWRAHRGVSLCPPQGTVQTTAAHEGQAAPSAAVCWWFGFELVLNPAASRANTHVQSRILCGGIIQTSWDLMGRSHDMGVFAQRQLLRSANYYGVYPGNTPENHPPTEACMINSKIA